MRIDIHNHFYPAAFLEKLEKDGASVGMEVQRDEWGRRILVQHGNRVVTITAPMTDIGLRLEDMDRAGFDQQVLTLTVPSVDVFPVEVGEELARAVNDALAGVCAEHPKRFRAFATLPFRDPDRAAKDEKGYEAPSVWACTGYTTREKRSSLTSK